MVRAVVCAVEASPVAALSRLHHQFKTEGKLTMPSPKELREQRVKLLSDARDIMTAKDVTSEQRAKADQMFADANQLQKDAQLLEQLNTQLDTRSSHSIQRDNPTDPTGEQDEDKRSHQERRRATNIALRAFLRKESYEKRDLTVGSNGSVMIPVGVADPKIAKQYAGSVYDLVYKLRTSNGEGIKIPYLNDLANLFVLNSASITTTDPATGGVTSQVDDIRSNPILIENSLVQDVSFDILGFIERATQNRYLRTASKWITLGNGSNVASLAADASFTQITSNTTLVTKYVDFTALLAALDPAYAANAAFLMSNATLANGVMNILDSNGRPIFLPFNDGGQSGFAGTIFGYPVKINPYQAGVAVGAKYIMFGDFESAYTFREVDSYPDVPNKLPGQGIVTLRRLDERYAELNKVGFVAFARVGGIVTNPGSLAGGTPTPVVTLVGHA